MMLLNKVFSTNSAGNVQIQTLDFFSSEYPEYITDAVLFCRDCIPAIMSLNKLGPVVLSGLPADFSLSLALAAWYCGRPVVFFDVDSTTSHCQSMLSSIEPSLWVTMNKAEINVSTNTLIFNMTLEDHSEAFENWLAQAKADTPQQSHTWSNTEIAIVLFTSGSTGEPKGVCHSLQNMLFSSNLFINQFDVTSVDHIFNLAPLHTMSGLRGSIFIPLLIGCSTQIDTVSDQLSSILDRMDQENSSILIAGPYLLKTLAKIAERVTALKNLRVILSTGAKLPREVRVDFWQKLYIPVLDYYGLTETCGLVISESREAFNPTNISMGHACNNITAIVVDENNKEANIGRGLLRIYSSAIFLGYWGGKPTRYTFFDTKDYVEINVNGEIKLVGRSGRSIKSAATTWLHPEAVENWLSVQSTVEDFAVTTDESHIICFVAFAASEGSSIQQPETMLALALQASLGKDYNATRWRKVGTIPRSNLGKVNWSELKKR